MRPELFTTGRAGPARLITMARPRGGGWLDDEITGLAASGVSVLVPPKTRHWPGRVASAPLTATAASRCGQHVYASALAACITA